MSFIDIKSQHLLEGFELKNLVYYVETYKNHTGKDNRHSTSHFLDERAAAACLSARFGEAAELDGDQPRSRLQQSFCTEDSFDLGTSPVCRKGSPRQDLQDRQQCFLRRQRLYRRRQA